jgi:SAM-dependent methyltransferase
MQTLWMVPKEDRTMQVLRLVVLVVGLSLCAACTQLLPSATPGPGRPGSGRDDLLQREPDVPYVATPPVVVAKMLELAQVTPDDVVYDLGSGDGRIVIMAAQRFGARGVGVEINPALVLEAHENAKRAGVANRVQFLLQDLFETDLRAATVVTLYLMESVNLELRPKLWRELQPGTRVVSHDFGMGDWPPEQVIRVDGHVIYAWTIPAAPGTKP